jgi:hypothetical protein
MVMLFPEIKNDPVIIATLADFNHYCAVIEQKMETYIERTSDGDIRGFANILNIHELVGRNLNDIDGSEGSFAFLTIGNLLDCVYMMESEEEEVVSFFSKEPTVSVFFDRHCTRVLLSKFSCSTG